MFHRVAGPGFWFGLECIADGGGGTGGNGMDGPPCESTNGHVAAADDRIAQGRPDQDPPAARVGAEPGDDLVEHVVGRVVAGADPVAAGGPGGQLGDRQQFLGQGDEVINLGVGTVLEQ